MAFFVKEFTEMNPILASGGPPPQEYIPRNLSAENMLLFAAWAHGMKAGDVAHRLALFGYVQSHIANKLEEPLQRVIENSRYWNRYEKGLYMLNKSGENIMRSQFGRLPIQADLNASYIFTRSFKGNVFQVTVNPGTRKLEPTVNNKKVSGVEACRLLWDLGATFVSPSTTSKTTKLLNWIIQDNNYSWQRLSQESRADYSLTSEGNQVPELDEPVLHDTGFSEVTAQGYQISPEIRNYTGYTGEG